MSNVTLQKYQELLDVVKKLLGPDGCPWDREQTHETLKHYLIEEAYEFVEAVEENDNDKMEEELGDLLFHVVIHAAIAENNNRSFTLQSITEKITQKMIRRHPHVFGDSTVNSVDDVWKTWDKIKQIEKKGKVKPETTLTAVPKNLPALLRAEKLQKRAARVGFDWQHTAPVWNKIDEEIGELKKAIDDNHKDHVREELGDLMFSIVNLARKLDIDPEEALQYTNKKFIQRFNHIEQSLIQKGKELAAASLEEMDSLWNEAKKSES